MPAAKQAELKKESAMEKVANEAKALRVLRAKHAAAIARQATIVLIAARELERIHKDMDTEAQAIAGRNYACNHTISFDDNGSIQEQLENVGTVRGAGIEDVMNMARCMAEDANYVEGAKGEAKLPSE
jgi:hypothetical protein